MHDSNQNCANTIILKKEGFPCFLREIIRIKRSKNPIVILSLFLSQYSTPTNCFYPPKETNMFDKSIHIFLVELNGTILSDTILFLTFLDFQLSLGYQLKNSDCYLLYKIFFIYPQVLKSTVPIVLSLQHPIEFLSIFILNSQFNQSVFQYQLKQSFTEDTDLLNRILKYVSEHKYPVHQNLYNNFSRIIPNKSLEKALKDNIIIPSQDAHKYNKESRPLEPLLLSGVLYQAFDIPEDNLLIQCLEKKSFKEFHQNHQFQIEKPNGSSFYIDGSILSENAHKKNWNLDKNESSSIPPKKKMNKDVVVFILFLFVLLFGVLYQWKHTSIA